MKHKYNLIIGIVIILGILLIVGCTRTIGPGTTQIGPCNWVYKTNADYFDLIHANLGYDEKGNEIIARIPGGMEKTRLSNGYIHELGACSKELGWVKPTNVAFLSKTIQEWLQEDINCKEEMKNKLNQLRIEKCGSLGFDIFEQCNTFSSKVGERTCSLSGFPPRDQPNPKKCTYDITIEESRYINSCKGHEYSIDMVIDRNPFTELYFCNMTFSMDDINHLIVNNQLDAGCERII